MPSLPQVQLHGRAGAVIPSKDDNANNLAQTATWLQNNASPFNTPPPRGDSIESITDLLSGTSTVPSRHESHLPQILPQYQVRGFMETNVQNRQNQEFIPWMHHNTSPFDNTPPPLGDSVESISDLLCLNVPRGSLLGNSNPLSITPSYNIPPRGYDFDANSSCQNGAGIKHSGASQVRCEPQNMSTPRKVVQSSHLDMTPTSPLQTISPICPPLNSPPHYSNRSTPDEVALGHHSQSDSPNDSNTSKTSSNPSQNEMQYNSLGGFSNASYCPSTEQELANLHNLYALRHARPTDAELMVKLIEHTSWLLWAATLNSPEYKPEEISMFDKVPRLHRSPKDKEVSCTWSGTLPPRIHKNPTYSCKVFLGGVPWDITEGALAQAFSRFGSIKVEWPGKDQAVIQPKGYNYIILETEKKVKALLDYCAHHFARGGNLYYRVSSRKMKSKEVQVIPWAISDSNCARASQKLDPQKTVFVGALHGMINAEALAKIMNELFGGVIYAGLDTDKYKYPIGSGRVTFSNYRSYMKAVVAAFIEVKTEQFTKKVQVDPYLEDASCSACNVQQGPYFCREMVCFRYYCRGCWALHHMNEGMRSHKYLTRNSKNSSHHITPFCTHLH